mgnify:CR=1 FL=1
MNATTNTATAPRPEPASDIEIARAAAIKPIADIGETLGVPWKAMVPYGHTKAKIDLDYIRSLADRPDGKLILVTGLTPTPPGEGKTTTLLPLPPTPPDAELGWHRTETVDINMLLGGELILVLDTEERTLHPGDVVIQRNTMHAWKNPTSEPVYWAAVLVPIRQRA